jgi:hypothetical protein
MLRTLIILVLLLRILPGTAQQQISQNEQPVFFPYVLGERADKKLKIMIIGSHLLRFANVNVGGMSQVETSITLDFYDINDPMKSALRVYPGDYDNIGFKKIEVESLHGTFSNWNSSTVSVNKLTQYDNTLSAMEKIRTKMIEQYRSNGYEIYQYDFTPQTDGRHSSGYKYLDTRTQVYVPYYFERLRGLSPLFVPYYNAEDIKSSLHALATQSVSSEHYQIPVPPKTDKEKIAEMTRKENAAKVLEAEGDKLFQSGTYFYLEALKKYQAAQNMYYTLQVKKKIDEINAWVTVGQGLVDAGQAVADGIEKVDPNKKTRITYGFLSYTGIAGNFSKIKNPVGHQPMEASFGFIGHRVLISMEARVGYYKSPQFDYDIHTVDFTGSTPTGQSVRRVEEGASVGLSGGINIPFKPIVFYALYGFDARFILSDKFSNPDYALEDKNTAGLANRISFGTTLRIPGSTLAIGAQYVMQTIKLDENGGKVTNSRDRNKSYFLRNTANEKYQYSSFNISFNWDLNNKKRKQ